MRFAEIRGSGLGSVIAENNSTKYYIKVMGTNYDIPAGEPRDVAGVYLNDVKISTILRRGLNVVKLDESMKVLEQITFDTYTDAEVQGQRVIDYLEATKTGLIAIFTWDSQQSSVALSKAMQKWGASAWIYHSNERFRYSWCGLYDCKTGNMVSDAAGGRGNSYPALLDYYIDTSADLGVTGAGQVVTQDPLEYSGTGKYLIKSYHDKKNMAQNFPQLKPGEWMQIRCDFKQDAASITAKVQCLLTMQFYDAAGTMLKGINITKSPGLNWSSYEIKSDIPAGAVSLDFGFYHYPSTVSTGVVFVRNVVAQPINKEVTKSQSARFGRFSAPSKEFREGTLTGSTVVKFTKDELIEASEMQEIAEADWVKVFEHRTLGQMFLFPDIDSGLYSEVPYLYSNMKMINDLRLTDGRWRFKLVYEEGEIEWEQSSSPEESSVTGLKIIRSTLPSTAKPMGGIRRTANVSNSRYDCNTGSTWFYAIGAMASHGIGFPGPTTGVSSVQLYAWKE